MLVIDFANEFGDWFMPIDVIKRSVSIDDIGASVISWLPLCTINAMPPQPVSESISDDITGEVITGGYEIYSPVPLNYDDYIIFNSHKYRVVSVLNWVINGGYHKINVVKADDDT